ncbi:dihydroxyacetone kinase subunit DhaL [Lacticaseibacillus pantheris]|uniref:phosphoenolpyruvate--glycerone phosphotransferase n=1 Tax=Lacticaseibacillus pantheris DSM 15945 = JCM 12539 = NBRC 106106 TaxID=1423783 RepID=A0A0R1UAA6_9LACO|nr:dihydroxyacetone kinase subunit DhaL [Lacticaseibacillus pantheris]KRL88067.1 dihydroxyacetone kinase phosphatase domain-containing protein [Lacticaseibacillus pantheris DSM 15945 = JCM 12539 = NBRC 106106]WKF84182.1 dihydroxyacetone kinase subunit DhaL [Lacticaseibacillus pantheris]
MTELTVNVAQQWLDGFAAAIAEHKDYLSELDTPIGDGDHGSNMARGLAAVQEAVDGKEFANLKDLFKSVAMALISKVGGASGPLYGTAFLEMAKLGDTDSDLGDLLAAALAGIEKRGGATPGDKTMVDVWTPVVQAVQAGGLKQSDVDAAVNSTEAMVARKGRASYLGERSVGHLDPGSMSSGYLFTALINTGVFA